MSELAKYDAMVYAIAECHRIDEVKDIRDKAMALATYYKQANNTQAERQACDVRLRAERRVGELLTEQEKEQGRRTDLLPASLAGGSRYQATIASAGIPERTARRYQQLANIPAAAFEAALRDSVVKPSTVALIQQARDPLPRIPEDVLWLWGRMRDFERDGFALKHHDSLLDAMTDSMRADVLRIAPTMAEFFSILSELEAA